MDDFLNTEESEDGPILSERPDAAQRLATLEKEPSSDKRDEVSPELLLKVKGISVHFHSGGGFLGKPRETVKAVNEVDLDIPKGRTLGLVGESGCGKTTLGRAILRLQQPTAGSVQYDGTELIGLTPIGHARVPETHADHFSGSLCLPQPQANDRTNSHRAPARSQDRIKPRGSARPGRFALEEVGLGSEFLLRYPHEFSGGQRQRISVARALAVEPEFVVCDECVSAMDVSVQAQVLNLLRELQDKRKLTYLFISHDLSVVKFMSDEIAVMRQGRIEEFGSANEVYENPQSDYTRELLEAVPRADF